MSNIKVFHTADLHFGIESYGKLDPATLVNSRIQDFFDSFDWLIEKAIEDSIDALIISGDIFHRREPSVYAQNEFSKRISRLITHDIPVAILIGNHDSILSIERISSLNIYKELSIPNVFIFDQPKIVTVSTKNGPLQIAGIPFYERSMIREYMVNQNIDDKKRDELVELVIKRQIGSFKKTIKPKIPTILMAHLTIKEAMYDNWRPTIVGNEIYLSKAVFMDPVFSYIAMGHIHKHQCFEGTKTEPVIAYPGSIAALDFGEASYEHGFMEVELCPGKISANFIAIPKQRRFIGFNLEIFPEYDLYIKCKELFDQGNFENDIVKISIVLHSNSEVDEQKIRRDFSDRCHIISSIHVDQQSRIQTRMSSLSSDMNPIEALQKYIEVQKDPFLTEHREELTDMIKYFLNEMQT